MSTDTKQIANDSPIILFYAELRTGDYWAKDFLHTLNSSCSCSELQIITINILLL